MDRSINTFSALERPASIVELRKTRFDLVVVGGGITGAGIALDAVTRGLKVCLVEKHDFSFGTSSRSTKLIHGGLRYLKQFEFGMVREIGHERAILHSLARHLVIPQKMLLPLIKGGSLGKTITSIGLYIYDFLAGVSQSDKRQMLSVQEILNMEPLLPEKKLLGGSVYAEYRTDDARLTIEILKTAHQHGALPINYVEATGFKKENGETSGIHCKDRLTGDLFDIHGQIVINATGPWGDDVRRLDGPIEGKHLYLTKGVHIVVPHEKLPVRQPVYFDVPGDSRMIFTIPRLTCTYIGTTDTYYSGDLENIPVTLEDVEYLLQALNHTFPGVDLRIDSIISSWAGLRPLIYEDGKPASEISRKDEIFEAESGLVTIAGGKLTGYRKMAEKVVDLVAKRLEKRGHHPIPGCKTEEVLINGNTFQDQMQLEDYIDLLKKRCIQAGLKEVYGPYLVHNYGSQAGDIIEMMERSPHQDSEINIAMAELQFCVVNEMVVFPMDFLIRRTGLWHFFPEVAKKVMKPVVVRLQEIFNRTDSETTASIREMEVELTRLTSFE